MVLWFGGSTPTSQLTEQEKLPIVSPERKETSSNWLHITKDQESTLDKFKQLCEAEGLFTPEEGRDQEEEAFDNAMLLRFLRANKFQLSSALDQFQTVSRMRADHDFEGLYRGMDVDCYEESRRMFSQWTGRRDHHGLPVYVFPLRCLTKEKMETYISKMSRSSLPLPPRSSGSAQIPSHLMAFHALYENMLHFVLPLCSRLPRPHPEVPVTSSTHIIDMTGLTLKQFLDIKRYLQAASELATTNYPETLGHVFIVGAPPALRVAWRFVKQWLDPDTLSKICILSPTEMQQRRLFTYMPATSIPVEYGGKLDWKWGDMPALDAPGNELADGLYLYQNSREIAGFVKGPVLWSRRGGIETVGTVQGKKRDGFIPVKCKTP